MRSQGKSCIQICQTTDQLGSNMETSEELALYDRTRRRLRDALAGHLSAKTDVESTLTAYAYWVCTAVRRRGTDWETALHDYIGQALRDEAREAEAEQREVALLRRALRAVPGCGPVLDVGAGWGRLAPLYGELSLQAVYVEPANLGVRLMRRSHLARIVRSAGEALPFPAATFPAALIGWVLHHHAPEVDAAGILREVARVLVPGGWLFSIEPLKTDFDMDRWMGLLTRRDVGIEVCSAEEFFRMPDAQGGVERYILLVGRTPAANR
jgi:SAM-dependent methyltransferase